MFSDEAHNTYGQELEKTMKKVRQTINYLAEKTDLKVVINTTGTPYFKKKILPDVVYWYGLIEGIDDGILKDVQDNIYSYSEVRDIEFLNQVLEDFFTEYKDLEIAGGHKTKIAIYFPKIEDIAKVKFDIEKKVIKLGLDINCIFEVHSKSSEKDKDIFINRINDKNLPYRIFLLVGMGKEGWNCPSLFACSLAREIKSSNNFVLQASTRCLRQIEGNTKSARIYLSAKNTKILENQLKETYGETIDSVQKGSNQYQEQKLVLQKHDKLPKIVMKKILKKYIKKENVITNLHLNKPKIENKIIKKTTLDFSKFLKGELYEKDFEDLIVERENFSSLFEASYKLASLYSLDYFVLLEKLQRLYPEKELTREDFVDLQKQIEAQMHNYEEQTEEVEIHLAIIKKEGFEEEKNEAGDTIYTTKILVRTDKLNLLKAQKNQNFSFHYNPYKFDSGLEIKLFDYIFSQLENMKQNIEDFLFIGGITDKNKTDLIFEYEDKNGVFRNYTPDFLVIKKNGECLFLETKGKVYEGAF